MSCSSSTPKPWKRQLYGMAIATILGFSSALPADSVSTNAANSIRVSAEVAPDITQDRVQRAQAFANNNIGAACCNLLKNGLGSLVSTPDSAKYQNSTQSYWSGQSQNVDPWCVVSPTNTSDVSKTVGSINLMRIFGLKCPFAIRSGGHTPWAGAATIQNGVQIDLAGINQVIVSKNQQTTSVGPGARWLEVYSKLDPLSLTVLGGRVSTVGVGGLITGGGISFFSPRAGFVIDSVVHFEVVLFDGSVVIASANSRPDLFFALKGGSNNFAVVTRIDLKTFSQGKFWGGFVVHPISAKAENLAAFFKFTGQASYDPFGALIQSYSWSTAIGGWIIANSIHYTKPVVNPPVFQEFTAIQPQSFSTMRISNLSDFAIELTTSKTGSRGQLFYTSTWSNDLATLTGIVDLIDRYVQTIATVPGLAVNLSFQPLVTAITSKSAATGGNPLGLDGSDGNLVLALVSASWLNPEDEAAVTAAVTEFYGAADEYAASRGALHPFKYLNYAYKTQNPIDGYGATNVAKLRAASKKYDPVGVFQKLVPGGWKL